MSQQVNDALDVSVNTDDDAPLRWRELLGLNETFKSLRGNLADQESQRVSIQQTITSLEHDITRLWDRLDQGVENEDDQRHVEHGIQKACNELAAREMKSNEMFRALRPFQLLWSYRDRVLLGQ